MRIAEEPGQAINFDLCFVPASHEAEVKLPAVSGSSGRMVVEQEDAAWQSLRQQYLREEAHRSKRRARYGERKAIKANWQALREKRQLVLEQRRQEDADWRQQRQALRERMSSLPIVTVWIAILVITDNCSRLCLGVPLFVAGSSTTAEMVVAALRTLLPEELQFLISDRGIHFSAQVFQELARTEDFIHVVIARHRPQSNGIAERFVRTLKEWLATPP